MNRPPKTFQLSPQSTPIACSDRRPKGSLNIMHAWRQITWGLFSLLLLASVAVAQPPAPDGPPVPGDNGPPAVPAPKAFGFDFSLPGDPGAGPKLSLKASFELQEGTSQGRLHVTAEPALGWHTFSITQADGGPQRTKLLLAPSTKFKVTGPFTPSTAPEVKHYDYYDVPIEEHAGLVTWTAPIELAPGVDPASLVITVDVDAQVCEQSCLPITERLEAKFTGEYAVAAATGTYTSETGNIRWQGFIEPKVASPGSTVKLTLTATPVEPFHIYAYAPTAVGIEGFSPTLISLKPLPAGWTPSPPKTSSKVQSKPPAIPGDSPLTYHAGPVTWTMDIAVPEDAEPGQTRVAGIVGFQVCTDQTCDLPSAAAFEVTVPVAAQAVAGQAPVAFSTESYSAAASLATSFAPQVASMQARTTAVAPTELLIAIGLGLIGGLILNLMPCVLPVIGLKVLSLAEQAGQQRARVLTLNVVYSLGILSVFMVLATLAVFINLSWGEHFGEMWFQVVVASVVFAMALSFLGVWEIPLPGFVGGSKTSELQQKEGLAGAFAKGMLTTVLSTPCSGPLLGSVFGLTLHYPPFAKYVIFGSVGLGMASPYLLVGAFPALVRWLPKPGAWMETLKQVMGFVLLGTVVYLIYLVNSDYRIATLSLLFAIWFACWWIGRVPIYEEFSKRATAWIGGSLTAAAIGWFAFTNLGPHTSILPWNNFSPAALSEARAQGKTVMIDFTARWCPTCHLNYATAIDTHAVKEIVERNGVVPMIADWSDRGATIKKKLEELESASIPLLAIYPADGSPPIVLRDLVNQSQVLEALEQAGPSIEKRAAGSVATLPNSAHAVSQ
jgi:thiol:disulfide interchange protein